MVHIELNLIEEIQVQIRYKNEIKLFRGYIAESGELVLPFGSETFILSPQEFRRDYLLNRCYIVSEKNKQKIMKKKEGAISPIEF